LIKAPWVIVTTSDGFKTSAATSCTARWCVVRKVLLTAKSSSRWPEARQWRPS
jgi:hypothetical protein